MKIIVAEDDRNLNDGIILALKCDGIQFIPCYTYRDSMITVEKELPDLLILDVNFPDGNGLDILKKIRLKKLPIKIIMLTANNMETDIVSGLELGADDYITKPFSLMVLRARVRVQIRNISIEEKDKKGLNKISIDKFYFDFERMIYRVDGETIELSKIEQKLLKALVENRGIILRREQLMNLVWNEDSDFVDEHALTVTIKRLRDKLKENDSSEGRIKTVYGIGYTWTV